MRSEEETGPSVSPTALSQEPSSEVFLLDGLQVFLGEQVPVVFFSLSIGLVALVGTHNLLGDGPRHAPSCTDHKLQRHSKVALTSGPGQH